MAKLLLGKEVTAAMNEKLQARVAALKEKGVSPKLAIVRCGENPSDLSYEKGATARAELIGVEVQKFVLPEDVSKEDLIAQIEAINADSSIHGCLMFRPLPKHLKADQDEICNHLAAAKDVDCMTDLSNAGVFTGKKLGFAPCTPQACMEILDYYGIDCKGKNAVVIGRSLVVGKPAAMMLMAKNATVTVCHTKTVDVAGIARKADILVSAAGVLEQPHEGLCLGKPDRHRRLHQLGPREGQCQGRQGRDRGRRSLLRGRADRRRDHPGSRRRGLRHNVRSDRPCGRSCRAYAVRSR